MNKSIKSWTKVHMALLKYFTGSPHRSALWNNVNTQEDLEAVQVIEDTDKLLVQQAFHEATSDYNSMDKCLLVNPWDVAKATGYDITVHFPKAQKPQETKGPQPFDTRRIFGWNS
jgi:hypothetical protein